MHKKVRHLANERLDFPDLRDISNYPEEEFDILGKYLISDSSDGYILQGFEVNLDSGLLINTTIEDHVAVFPNGKFHRRLSTESQFTLSMADNSTNYVEAQVFTENTNNQTRVFWDPTANSGAGEEFSQNIDVLTKQDIRLVVNQVAFSGDTDKIPVAIIVTSGGVIERIHDNYDNQVLSGSPADPIFPESLFFRLNDQDNDGNTDDYNFGSPRTDTEINNLKEFINADFTQLKHIIGDGRTTAQGPNNDWFDAVPTNLFACNQDRNLRLQGGGNISWSTGTNNLTFDADFEISIPGISGSNVIQFSTQSPISLLSNGDIASVSIDRDASGTVNLTVTVSTLAAASTDKDVFIIAERRNDLVFMADGTLLANGDTVQLGKQLNTPSSTTDNAITRWDGANGNSIQDSGVIIDDSDNVTGIVDLTATGGISGDYLLPTGDDSSAPGANRLYRANVPKGWAHLDLGSSPTVTITDDHNVSSASWSTSVLTVNIDTDMANSTYVALANESSASGIAATTQTVSNHLAGSFEVIRKDNTLSPTNWASGTDCEIFFIGDQ